jgi:hypothetical protein
MPVMQELSYVHSPCRCACSSYKPLEPQKSSWTSLLAREKTVMNSKRRHVALKMCSCCKVKNEVITVSTSSDNECKLRVDEEDEDDEDVISSVCFDCSCSVS